MAFVACCSPVCWGSGNARQLVKKHCGLPSSYQGGYRWLFYCQQDPFVFMVWHQKGCILFPM
jgi:hypothetical protein